MKREFLQEFRVGEEGLPKEVIDAIMAENGRDIQKVKANYADYEDLKQQLLATGELVLEEGNIWGDTFWGVDAQTREGRNHLGRILMRVRKELQGG